MLGGNEQLLLSGAMSLPFHESFALAVSQDASFTSAAFSDQAASTIDTGRVELHKL